MTAIHVILALNVLFLVGSILKYEIERRAHHAREQRTARRIDAAREPAHPNCRCVPPPFGNEAAGVRQAGSAKSSIHRMPVGKLDVFLGADGKGGRVVHDGHDISDSVRAVTLKSEVGSLTTAVIETFVRSADVPEALLSPGGIDAIARSRGLTEKGGANCATKYCAADRLPGHRLCPACETTEANGDTTQGERLDEIAIANDIPAETIDAAIDETDDDLSAPVCTDPLCALERHHGQHIPTVVVDDETQDAPPAVTKVAILEDTTKPGDKFATHRVVGIDLEPDHLTASKVLADIVDDLAPEPTPDTTHRFSRVAMDLAGPSGSEVTGARVQHLDGNYNVIDEQPIDLVTGRVQEDATAIGDTEPRTVEVDETPSIDTDEPEQRLTHVTTEDVRGGHWTKERTISPVEIHCTHCAEVWNTNTPVKSVDYHLARCPGLKESRDAADITSVLAASAETTSVVATTDPVLAARTAEKLNERAQARTAPPTSTFDTVPGQTQRDSTKALDALGLGTSTPKPRPGARAGTPALPIGWVTQADAAAQLEKTTVTITAWINAGKLDGKRQPAATRVGYRYIVSQASIDDLKAAAE